ncbi:MAG: hypothetical protein HY907_03125 [Deltaproteobacteria bacterium]|nr:hypothetical protein [Deltaproteobacteria bacterium]
MARLRLPTVLACLACATACGNDDTSLPADGGDSETAGNGVLYETCPTTCATTPTCTGDQILSCCTCIEPPVNDAQRTPCGQMSDYCDEAPPDPVNVACLMESGWPEPPPVDPPTVTVRGVVDVYGNGNTSAGGDITVEFYRMAADGSTDGAAIGTDLATLAACDESLLPAVFESGDEATCCPGACQELLPDTSDCTPESGDCRQLWLYEVAGIPTSTPLILHTSGDRLFWKDLYYSNVFFFPEEEEPGGYVYYRAKTLSVDDWRGIPASAGDFDGIAPGQGAVAGEIHDCDNVKLVSAMVGVNPAPGILVYFNGVEEKPYPNTMRRSTNIDSLYAALEIPPGQVRVSALAQVEGVGLVNLGWWDAQVIADALTVVTIRGTRPTQVSAAP